MNSDKADQTIQKHYIQFLNGHCATSVTVALEANARDILNTLDIQKPEVLIMIAGATSTLSEDISSYLTQLCNRGIMPVVYAMNAMIIDGGTEAGVIQLIGQGAKKGGHRFTLMGIACAGLVLYPGGPSIKEELLDISAPLEPNHSHFVLVDAEVWGSETEMMYALAELISKDIPVMTLVVSGGNITKNEVLQSVRRGWPLLIIEGTGRMADEIAHLWRENPSSIEDKDMREIITKGIISLFPFGSSPQDLEKELLHYLVNK